MFKTIVWANDGSEPAEMALPLVKELASEGTIGGLLLGSVTNRLLHLAPCPVLVVPVTTPAA